ncbi:MAG: menaquinone biosynthesis protein [Verrucomicrobia bacterium]|nr:menaquinone biosynthesis protein [Verrucomicrobiota bacterium]
MHRPRLGCVKYLNARPLIQGWRGEVDFDHPSALCRKLARGELDVALVSSIEYLRRPTYGIVNNVAIAAFGPVYSVIVAHKQELASISEVEVDPASETSVALLRCLLAHYRLSCQLAPARSGADVASGNSAARLLIGDQAIRFRRAHPEYKFWDLAEQWQKITGLPLVFALWLVRPEINDASNTANHLRALRDKNLRHIDRIVQAQTEFEPEFCLRYFTEYLRFEFGAQEKSGLREFYRRSVDCGIDVAPQFELNLV